MVMLDDDDDDDAFSSFVGHAIDERDGNDDGFSENDDVTKDVPIKFKNDSYCDMVRESP